MICDLATIMTNEAEQLRFEKPFVPYCIAFSFHSIAEGRFGLIEIIVAEEMIYIDRANQTWRENGTDSLISLKNQSSDSGHKLV